MREAGGGRVEVRSFLVHTLEACAWQLSCSSCWRSYSHVVFRARDFTVTRDFTLVLLWYFPVYFYYYRCCYCCCCYTQPTHCIMEHYLVCELKRFVCCRLEWNHKQQWTLSSALLMGINYEQRRLLIRTALLFTCYLLDYNSVAGYFTLPCTKRSKKIWRLQRSSLLVKKSHEELIVISALLDAIVAVSLLLLLSLIWIVVWNAYISDI